MTRLVNDPDFTLYVGDALDWLGTLPAGSVDCVVTSPPYWGLRDYSTNGQLGLEAASDEYVARMVEVFREVRRVLADHGTCWINLGDSYGPGKQMEMIPARVALALKADGWVVRCDVIWSKPNPMPESVTDRPTKSHEYVFLLTKGPRYFFDQEAVREQFETTHAPGRAITPTQHYGADNGGNEGLTGHLDAVKARLRSERANPDQLHVVGGNGIHVEPDGVADEVAGAHLAGGGVGEDLLAQGGADTDGEGLGLAATSLRHTPSVAQTGGGRNVRSVWEIATRPFPEAHFATYPPELVRRCILAGCPERVCETCGKPSERIVERKAMVIDRSTRTHPLGHTRSSGTMVEPAEAVTVGWSDCGHNAWRPGTVLDPFLGSGTTALVAREHGRRCVGIELNPDYAEMAARRLGQLSLLA